MIYNWVFRVFFQESEIPCTKLPCANGMLLNVVLYRSPLSCSAFRHMRSIQYDDEHQAILNLGYCVVYRRRVEPSPFNGSANYLDLWVFLITLHRRLNGTLLSDISFVHLDKGSALGCKWLSNYIYGHMCKSPLGWNYQLYPAFIPYVIKNFL